MRKRLWLLLGIIAGMLLYALLIPLWNGLSGAATSSIANMLVSGGALTALTGFVYLHIPEAKRSLRTGLTIGAITGLLAGAFRVHDAGPTGGNATLVLLGILLLGAAGGIALALCELQWNPNHSAV